MPGNHSFEHLSLVRRFEGAAKLRGNGKPSPQTLANKQFRAAHTATLTQAADRLAANWQARLESRSRAGDAVPPVPAGFPILLKIDPDLEIDQLRSALGLEIVCEQEDGYVIVASESIDLAVLRRKIKDFGVSIHGSATVASVHMLFDDPDQQERLGRILSDQLMEAWGAIDDVQNYVIDIGVACVGTIEIPSKPTRGETTPDDKWDARMRVWTRRRDEAYDAWDVLKSSRESALNTFVQAYGGTILRIRDAMDFESGVLSDSFSVRLRISGQGLRDLILNFPFIFEVAEPEDIEFPRGATGTAGAAGVGVAPIPPDAGAPAVCIIDSGIQEGHVLLRPAIDTAASYNFMPGTQPTDVADYVSGGGHGTRVAGAVLYGENIPLTGTPQLPFWIQNARVLDQHNQMPQGLFPADAIRAAVERFRSSARATRIFNHSINAYGYCRLRHMSSWAAEIDAVSAQYDVLVVQSAGNLSPTGPQRHPGIEDHLNAGREYPAYLCEPASRISSPAQSLQALTVGSVGYGAYSGTDWRSFVPAGDHPAAFSRSGPGIWDVLKPEVVEYGGDFVRSTSGAHDVRGSEGVACPPLVRSTMYPPGPAADRDAAGTSFAAPKVARIAARVQQVLPAHSALLYRALVVQSAQWPAWAGAVHARLQNLRARKSKPAKVKQELAALQQDAAAILRTIGFGIPNESRATENDVHRTTLITDEVGLIKAGECHVYQVPIPSSMRRPGDEYEVRVDVTLSYAAQPRRTRRRLNRYLSTWVDWTTNKLGQGMNDFLSKATKDHVGTMEDLEGQVLPWTLHEATHAGVMHGVRRNSGTVQKDWAVVKSNTLPDHFCIAVRGHKGWSQDPDSTAKYALAVTFEIVGKEIEIYDALRVEVNELRASIESEIESELE